MLSHSPVSDPTTTTSSATNRTLTPRRLAFRLVPLTSGPMNKPGRQPSRGDPEEPDLHVPRARDAVGQPLRKRNAVEAVAFDAIVGRDDAEQHLHQDQGRRRPKNT